MVSPDQKVVHSPQSMTMSQRLYQLCAKHGLENVLDTLKYLVVEQQEHTENEVLNNVIKCLEDAITASCAVNEWL